MVSPETVRERNRPTVPAADLEKYSAAITLSDMEIFVFPELLYSLVIANILSPRLWAWRQDEWFRGIEQATPHQRILRLKQFLIDRYEFNLDLDTWGLTTKERELKRFRHIFDEQALKRSNALFGYEGDRYYFDEDIRRHFGLDKYRSNIIPYWKTETLEAMDAFRFKAGYRSGAGECVSLSTLYAAALFVVCRIPLERIYLMATPLHSQNFIDVGAGYLTNNRRVITRTMWFNGTEQSSKAQRALRHEQVTIVAHHTGYIHRVFPQATIGKQAYQRFKAAISDYLRTDVTMEILSNFLRDSSNLQQCFQLRHEIGGKARYIGVERVFAYEHAAPYKVSDRTRGRLLDQIDEDEFFTEPLPGRLLLNKFDDFFHRGHVDLGKPADVKRLAEELNHQCQRAGEILGRLAKFARLQPRYPDQEAPKTFTPGPVIRLTPDLTREQILSSLESSRAANPVADLAFYAYRDLARTDWAPFLKAALERNPVSIKGTEKMPDDEVVTLLQSWPNESIYDGTRVAQPDEIWNYQRGDGLEKAICMANILRARYPQQALRLAARDATVKLEAGPRAWTWPTRKGIAADHEL